MKNEKVTFINKDGYQLSARIAFPELEEPKGFAVFAHCFTCNKNLSAIKNISRALTDSGFAVLRFDFTGLGESEGDFEDTNFSSNVSDLIAAANFLKTNYKAPQMLIGHSLGGAAVLFAAKELDYIQSIVTIGAPSNPEHVSNLLQNNIHEIQESGEAEVSIGGRPFRIKKQFLEDLQSKNINEHMHSIRKSVLVMHSPQDTTVGISNAADIYKAAHHPKSFISLDGADHLLSDKKDSLYVGQIIAAWSSRYLIV